MRIALPLLLAGLLSAEMAHAEPDAEAARQWILANAKPLASIDPEVKGSDIAALDAIVGQARIAGFGEATHGGREIFQMKDRALRHLVEHDGFTAFAIEANYAEAQAIDAWIKGGPGDPRALVSAMGFWTWDTEEVLALVKWLRAWNGSHERKVSFYGVDMQFAPPNLTLAFDYLDAAGLAPAADRKVFADYLGKAVSTSTGYRAIAAYPPEEARALRRAAEALYQQFEAERPRLVAATGEPAYLRAKAAALAAAWYFVMEGPNADLRFRALRQDYDVRDRAMADLAKAALEMEGPKGRIFLWAHNTHVSKARHIQTARTDERLTMGLFLAQELGPDYVSIGFAFDHGAFQAFPPRDPARPDFKPTLSEMRVGPAPGDHAEAVLRAGPAPAFALDLRQLDPGTPAYGWFAEPRQLRWTGANYSVELMAKHAPIDLIEHFDALIFVHESTRARPN